MENWGERYFDHYLKYFGPIKERKIFESGDAPSIQILTFENVFENCRTFCSLGLSHYSEEIGETAEVFVTTDDYWDAVPTIFANMLFFIVGQKMQIGWGMNVGGFEKLF